MSDELWLNVWMGLNSIWLALLTAAVLLLAWEKR